MWAGQNWTCYIHEVWGSGGEGVVDGGGRGVQEGYGQIEDGMVD